MFVQIQTHSHTDRWSTLTAHRHVNSVCPFFRSSKALWHYVALRLRFFFRFEDNKKRKNCKLICLLEKINRVLCLLFHEDERKKNLMEHKSNDEKLYAYEQQTEIYIYCIPRRKKTTRLNEWKIERKKKSYCVEANHHHHSDKNTNKYNFWRNRLVGGGTLSSRLFAHNKPRNMASFFFVLFILHEHKLSHCLCTTDLRICKPLQVASLLLP